MLGAYLSFFLGVVFCFGIRQLYNQINDFFRGRKTIEPHYIVRKYLILRLAYKLYYTKFCQILILVIRVIICLFCVLLFMGYLFLRTTEWGDIFD